MRLRVFIVAAMLAACTTPSFAQTEPPAQTCDAECQAQRAAAREARELAREREQARESRERSPVVDQFQRGTERLPNCPNEFDPRCPTIGPRQNPTPEPVPQPD